MRSRLGAGLASLADSFRTHKLTAFLSTMGVAIGSASLVLVVTAGRAGQQYVIEQIEGVGANLVYAEHVSGGGQQVPGDAISRGDLEAVRAAVPGVINAAGSRISR